MNRLAILYGCVLISSSAIAEKQQDIIDMASVEVIVESEGKLNDLLNDETYSEETFYLDINDIEYIEEEEVQLDFDTKDYLPEGFDPYTLYFDLNSIEYVEHEEDTPLGFNTANYLPVGFDPYSEKIDVKAVNFIEEEDLELGFDTAKYLPNNFSPYEVYFDLNSIIYIEIEELDEQDMTLPCTILWENEPYN